MKKKTYSGINLNCVFQNQNPFETEDNTLNTPLSTPNSICLTGIISKTQEGFRFEEEIKKGRPPRNPKLYDGRYISLVRMVNGRYQMHAKTMNLEKDFDPATIAYGFYQDVINALSFIV